MSVVAPALLLAYALLAAMWGPSALTRWRSLDRSAVASIVMWQVLSLSALVSVVLAGLALAVPAIPLSTNVADLMSACADALRSHYATPGGAVTSVTGALMAGAVVARAAWTVSRQLWNSNRQRCRQRLAVRLVARTDDAGSFIIDSQHPAVYCVPGGERTVVLTSAALSRLDASQVAAVLAHEDVHLKYRHDLVLAMACGLRSAFPFVALYATGATELARLVEMHADDAAATRHDRRALATALLGLVDSRSPLGSLGAGGASTVRRVSRLVAPPSPISRARSVGLAAMVAVMMSIPVVLVALPAIGVAAVHYCPVNWQT